MRHLHGQFGQRKIRTAPTEETGELPWKVNPKNRPELPKNTPSKLACATSFRTANAAAAGAVTSANNVAAKSNKPGTKRQRKGHSGEAPCRALKLHRYRRDAPLRVVKLMLIGPKAKLLAIWPSLAVWVVPAKSVNWSESVRPADTVSEVAVPDMQCTPPGGVCVPGVTLGGLMGRAAVPFFQPP